MTNFTEAKTRTAIQAVSASISPTGRQPAAKRSLNDVFMPSAAIAVTRHQRETSFARSISKCGIRPKLLARTSRAKAIRKPGKVARARALRACSGKDEGDGEHRRQQHRHPQQFDIGGDIARLWGNHIAGADDLGDVVNGAAD